MCWTIKPNQLKQIRQPEVVYMLFVCVLVLELEPETKVVPIWSSLQQLKATLQCDCDRSMYLNSSAPVSYSSGDGGTDLKCKGTCE